jgi:hypothetical protein
MEASACDRLTQITVAEAKRRAIAYRFAAGVTGPVSPIPRYPDPLRRCHADG